MYTVKRLLEELQRLDPDLIVVMSSDPEGNSFDTLHTVEEMMYNPQWREIGYRELTEQMREQGYTDEDIMDETDGQPAVILWP